MREGVFKSWMNGHVQLERLDERRETKDVLEQGEK